MQISQFIIDLGTVFYAYYSYIAYNYFPSLPHQGNCYGTENAATFGCAILTSYLLLFIDFYIRTYKPAGVAAKAKAKAEANGHANGQVNGYANGHANGSPNGGVNVNGVANGKAY